MMRVLIIDDHPIFRHGLALSLAETGDIAVCGEGASADEALALAQSLHPDILLLDLSMPGGGLAILPLLVQQNPGLRVAVLTASEDSEDVMRALQAGAAGYLLKGVGARTLAEALRAIMRGEGYVEPTLAARILSEMGSETELAEDPQNAGRERLLALLTPREREVLRLVAAGCSNKEVARRAEMQEKTVKHHMTRILQKLNARNRTEAAMILRGERR